MYLKLPSNSEKIHWTSHSKEKMKQYLLSEKRVLRVFREPERKEEGIAPGTIAVMQVAGTKKHPKEIWLMYQVVSTRSKNQSSKMKKVKIISTWRYPGRTPAGKPPLIPDDILNDLDNILKDE